MTQLGSVVLRQLQPTGVDRVEERSSGLAGLGLVDEVGDPRREVGVLDRDDGGVAPDQVLEAVRAPGGHPAASRRGRDHQVGPLEATRALEIGNSDRSAVLRVLGGLKAGERPDRLRGSRSGEGGDLRRGRTTAHERAAFTPQRVPRDERLRATGPQGGRRLRDAVLGVAVGQGERPVGEVGERPENQTAHHQVGATDHDGPPDRLGGPRPDLAAETVRQPQIEPVQPAAAGHQPHEQQRRDHGQEQLGDDSGCFDAHEVANLRLPPASGQEGHEQRDRGDHEEDAPASRTRRAGLTIGERAPHPGTENPEAVADRGADPAHRTLDDATARKQRRGERQAGEDQRDPRTWQRVAEPSTRDATG